jgi:hypothetical protein
MAWFYWFRRRWTARVRYYTAFTFKVAIPSFFMALAAVWFYGGFRDFSLQRLIDSTHVAMPKITIPGSLGLCLIKGNISDKGERIYHVPGGRYYDATVIELSKGERWFCSEAEARAAGWRKSKL